MLVLTREAAIEKLDTILVGPDIRVTILEVRGRKVRVGIAAPEGVVILREELAPIRDGDGDGRGRERR